MAAERSSPAESFRVLSSSKRSATQVRGDSPEANPTNVKLVGLTHTNFSLNDNCVGNAIAVTGCCSHELLTPSPQTARLTFVPHTVCQLNKLLQIRVPCGVQLSISLNPTLQTGSLTAQPFPHRFSTNLRVTQRIA
jgi:hypothetical protein